MVFLNKIFSKTVYLMLVILTLSYECHAVNLSSHTEIQNNGVPQCSCPDFPSVITKTKSAVVNIRADGRSKGTGFIIHPSGKILTNLHVVTGTKRLQISDFEGDIYPAVIIAREKGLDMALLKIRADKPLPYLELDAAEPVVGEWIIVLGNPFGVSVSATIGIVSAKHVTLGSSTVQWIQVDATVNPGNSGGPLINLKGKVIGVISSHTTMGHGLGFAVPIREIYRFILPLLNPEQRKFFIQNK